jgi:Ubiquitin-like modifier-activating enzyme ATG7 N-terminus
VAAEVRRLRLRQSQCSNLVTHSCNQLWETLTSHSPNADALNTFLVLTFADLKKYKYYYWFTFPAFVAQPAWEIEGELDILDGDEVGGRPISSVGRSLI